MTKGQEIGYVRVSTVDQNSIRQLYGMQLDRVFRDEASGGTRERPQLQEMRKYVREEDTLYVHSMDRLARNLDDLRLLVHEFTEKGVRVVFIAEGLTFTGDGNPYSLLLLSVIGAVAEFERSLIRARQMEGIAAAKMRGVYKGRKPSLNGAQMHELRRRVGEGESVTVLAREFRISRQTVYTYLRQEAS